MGSESSKMPNMCCELYLTGTYFSTKHTQVQDAAQEQLMGRSIHTLRKELEDGSLCFQTNKPHDIPH